jgi:hypothetical protein
MSNKSIQMALKLGLSYLPIASELVAALSKWQKELPLDVLVPLLADVVPLFDKFLHSKGKIENKNTPLKNGI